MPLSRPELNKRCIELLHEYWDPIVNGVPQAVTFPSMSVSEHVADAIQRSVNSHTKTYRYVILTQVLAKAADPSLDSHCLQVSRGGSGCFDARSLCHEVVVPFDRENQNVLGGSAEPYANNPVRVPEVTADYRDAQRNKKGWDDLCIVLDELEKQNNFQFTFSVLHSILSNIHDRLEGIAVSYPIPRRVSHSRLLIALKRYLSYRSGGVRLQTIVSALFIIIGRRFSLFSNVRSNKPTAADSSTGQVADIECLDADGNIALAVEAKDRELTVTQVYDKIAAAREARVNELLFIVEQQIHTTKIHDDEELIERSFASGHNVYIFSLEDFSSGILALLGEIGRHEFLEVVGQELERYQAPLNDRKAWAALLREL